MRNAVCLWNEDDRCHSWVSSPDMNLPLLQRGILASGGLNKAGIDLPVDMGELPGYGTPQAPKSVPPGKQLKVVAMEVTENEAVKRSKGSYS